ncbi:MAG TPA: Ku protein [Burkholderiaceae bacterium]|nr:Ku protein [Burkholderiaceae bacterium]
MPRAIASLSLSFGLVSIPVKLYSATESSSAIRFKLMRSDGVRVKQQYISEEPEPPSTETINVARARAPERSEEVALESPAPASNVRPFTKVSTRTIEPEVEEVAPVVVERSDMVKGYEFEKGKFVLFTTDELKALEEGARQTVDIVAFVPQETIDPIYYDKAYFLAPDKRGNKPYSLLHEAMRSSGRCALAKWAWRSKQYVVQVRAAEGGLVLQQLLYAEEVRSLRDLKIDWVPVGKSELQLALQLIEHISEDAFDPTQFVDEEKQRILAAVEKKIAGKEIVAPQHVEAAGAEVIDLMAALRASLSGAGSARTSKQAAVASEKASSARERKPAQRAAKSVERSTPRKVSAKK